MLCRTAFFLGTHMITDGWRPDFVGYVDSDVVPARCHYMAERYADNCDTVLQSVADSWAAQVDVLGFAEPMPDEDGILDIYISDDETEGGAWTYGPYEDEDDGDDRMGCHAYIVLDPTISEADLPSFVSHEFNHVLQYATDFVEPTLPIWEATASAAEAWTYPDDLTVEPYYIIDFQKTPWLGILGDSYMLWDDYDIWSYYEYGAALWILHLDALWGDGAGSAGPALWWAATETNWNNEPDVLDAYDEVTGGWRDALLDLSVERTRLGTDYVPDWASFMGSRGKISTEVTLSPEDLPYELTPEVGPFPTGIIYARVSDLTAGQTIRATIADEGENDWGMVAVEGPLDDRLEGTEIEWTAGGDDIFVGAMSFGPSAFDADRTIRPATMTLTIELVEVVADTGDTGEADDTGGEEGSGEEGGGEGGEDTGGEDPKSGCGCAAGGAASGILPMLLGLAAVARRRR